MRDSAVRKWMILVFGNERVYYLEMRDSTVRKYEILLSGNVKFYCSEVDDSTLFGNNFSGNGRF